MNWTKESKKFFKNLNSLDEKEKIEAINKIKLELHNYSPLKNEPVDCVLWVPSEKVIANDYNPNKVAPPEMRLLRHSISEDGYTQPIVTWKKKDNFEVVDGFHRFRVGTECKEVRERIRGYLPVTAIQETRKARNNRIASTIRHNRARGKHSIDGMAEIVLELKRRNWSNKKIGKELGMDPDEILRLSQITGLADMFSDKEFSEAWEADVELTINDGDGLRLNEEVIEDEKKD